MAGFGSQSECVNGYLVNGRQKTQTPTTYPQEFHDFVEGVNLIILLGGRQTEGFRQPNRQMALGAD